MNDRSSQLLSKARTAYNFGKTNGPSQPEFEDIMRGINQTLKPLALEWSKAVAGAKAWCRAGSKGRYPGPYFPKPPAETGDDKVDALIADEYALIKSNYDRWMLGQYEEPGVYNAPELEGKPVPVVASSPAQSSPPES